MKYQWPGYKRQSGLGRMSDQQQKGSRSYTQVYPFQLVEKMQHVMNMWYYARSQGYSSLAGCRGGMESNQLQACYSKVEIGWQKTMEVWRF